MSTPLPPEPKKKTCLERTIVFLVRLFFAFVVGIAIGLGVYFGFNFLYGEYQTLTQDYDARITALETNQAQAEQLVTDRLSGFQTRLETLEIQGDTQKEAVTNLNSQLDKYEEILLYQATAIAGQQLTQEGMQETLLSMQTEISVLQSNLDAIQNIITRFNEDILALESNTTALTEGVAENQAAVAALNESVISTEARMAAVESQMVFLQAMELLTRARLNLVQGNTTLAQSDIEAARDLLTELQTLLPPYQAEYVGQIIVALEDTLKFLPNAPLTAADKLEGAWQFLAAGLPDESAAEAASETDEEIEGTPTPEATPEITPSLTPTP